MNDSRYNADMDIDSLQFSQREREVIHLLLKGKSNKQIALELGISTRTVEFHLSNIYAKLGVNSRSEAILEFTKNELRESPGGGQGESTVESADDSDENGTKTIFRSIAMNKTVYLLGSLLVIIGVAVLIALKPSAQPVTPKTQVKTQATSTHGDVQASPVPISTDTPVPPPTVIPPTSMAIPPQTVNGYTAAIDSSYADASHILFQVRLTNGTAVPGSDFMVAGPNLFDEYGSLLNASVSWGPAVDPALYQFEFIPTTLLTGNHVKGQLVFEADDPNDHNQVEAQFRFDFDIPLNPETRFYPKQAVAANGLEILLDSVTVAPAFTQIYVCLPLPSHDVWNIGSPAVLKMGEQEVALYTSSELFDSFTGSYWGIRSEPNWTPPTKNGSCFKLGFPVGSTHADTFTLTIPDLEKSAADILLTDQLAKDDPGLSKKQAYRKYLEEHGNIYQGPWVFTVKLTP